MQVAKDVQPVVDGDDDHVAAPGQVGAVVHCLRAGALCEAAPVKPDHDRASTTVFDAGSPHVEHQAVLALGQVPHVPIGADDGVRAGLVNEHPRLWADRAEITRVPDVCPWFDRQRWQKAPVATGRGAVGDALEGQNLSLRRARDAAPRGLDARVFHRSCLLNRDQWAPLSSASLTSSSDRGLKKSAMWC